jgi:Flp pilus assembly protein TadD
MRPSSVALRLAALAVAASLSVACGGPPKPANDLPPPTDAEPAGPAEVPASKADADIAAAEAALKDGDAARAKKAAEAALAKDEKSSKAHYYAGVAGEALGEKEAAEKHYRRALELSPGLSDAAVNLSALLLDAGRAADAAAVLKPLAGKGDPLVAANYAAVLAASGDHPGALAAYETAIKGGGGKDLRVRLGYAHELVKAARKDDAAKALREGLSGLADDRDLLSAMARGLAEAGAYDDAIKTIDRAIKLKSSADLLVYRALFRRGAKDPAGAKTDLDAAIAADAKIIPAYVYLGEVLEELKKPADAKKAYEKAIELGGDSPPAKKARERLESLKGKK